MVNNNMNKLMKVIICKVLLAKLKLETISCKLLDYEAQ